MAAKYETLSSENIAAFLERHVYSVIHLDAEWDGYRLGIQSQIESIMPKLPDVGFAYIDVDKEMSFAASIKLVNTPSLAYYNKSELVAVVIGLKQNISENIKLVKQGRKPDTTNQISRF